jgi:Domain of unknown function (DUF5658)
MKGGMLKSQRDRFFGKPSLLGWESLLLVLLSLGDLLVTYQLLWQGKIYEANPLARWIFEQWNIAGMAFFKFGLIAFVIIAGETIEHRRPGMGRMVVRIGSVAAGAVMVYGLGLLHVG